MTTKQEIIAAVLATCDRHPNQAVPEEVIEAARDPSSVLHARFTWDDEAAGHRTRMAEARALIRQVEHWVRYEERTLIVPTFVSDPRTDQSLYLRTSSIVDDAEVKALAMRNEVRNTRARVLRLLGLAVEFGYEATAFDDFLRQLDAFEAALSEPALEEEPVA